MPVIRTPRELGAVLREHRRRLALGQAELAEKIGTNRRWVIEVEGGKPGAEVGLVLQAFLAVGARLSVEPAERAAPRASTPSGLHWDIDAIVDGARAR
jgi:HTH-type transcriptional regulator/antitoxin HipB